VSDAGAIASSPPIDGELGKEPGRWRDYLVAAGFLAPAFILLGVWIVYPALRTAGRSFFNADGSRFVWFDNYKSIFTSDFIVTAIKNNAIWIGVVPALVTAIGLVFAVLVERVRWSVAFKLIVFMPMAISLFAAGVIWRIMDQKEPDRGAVNAVIAVAKDAVSPAGVLSEAVPSTPTLAGTPGQSLVLQTALHSGSVARLGLTAIPPDGVPAGAEQAKEPDPVPGGIAGVVWRDFKPGGGTPGKVEAGELGLPGVTVELRSADGGTVGTTATEADGSFAFDDVGAGDYQAAIGSKTFAKPFGGVSWLGPKLITPALIMAYIWVWAGFSMVVIAAGLAAIPRDVLEAARTDGAGEWQVFRRVTVPLLAPVLTVVFVTMLINVLKVFDIVLAIAPGSVQDDANVIALAMWRVSFGGVNDFGLGSALAVFLFILVLPVLLLNIRRFRREI
jgi:alpha-glucoside transport system permease protein